MAGPHHQGRLLDEFAFCSIAVHCRFCAYVCVAMWIHFRILQLDLRIRPEFLASMVGVGVGLGVDAPSANELEAILGCFHTVIHSAHLQPFCPEDMSAALCGMNEVC